MATRTSDADEPDEQSVEALGYERARDELVGVVRMLEQGGLDLDESLTLWERGEALARRCEEHLEGARRRIETALGDVDADVDDEITDDDDDGDLDDDEIDPDD